MWLRGQLEKTTQWSIMFTLAASPSLAFAASSNPGAAGAPLFLACAIACLTRRRAIGGWLFYFYLQLFLGLLLWPLLFATNIFKNLSPSEWQSSKEYALFLLSTVPLYTTMCIETFFATIVLFRRDIEHVRFVRYSLLAFVAAALLSLIIDIAQSDENIPLDVLTLSFAVIWCLYFFRSHRVQWVLVENRWNHEAFSNRFGVPTTESLAASTQKGWITAIVVFFIFISLFSFAQEPPNPLAGVFQGLVWGAIIGALVQYFAKRPKRAKEETVKAISNLNNSAGAAVKHERPRADPARDGLNRRQKVILFATALLAVVVLLFPPFVIHHPQSGATYNSGFAFLFSQSNAVVNTGLLALELVVVAVVGVIGVFLTKNN